MAAFRNDNNPVVLAVIVVVLEQRANVVDIDLLFGDEDNVRAGGNARCVSDPAGVPAHHFDNDDAIVRVGGRVDAIDGFGGDHDRSVKAEGLIGAADVVVDGLGNAAGFDGVLRVKW